MWCYQLNGKKQLLSKFIRFWSWITWFCDLDKYYWGVLKVFTLCHLRIWFDLSLVWYELSDQLWIFSSWLFRNMLLFIRIGFRFGMVDLSSCNHFDSDLEEIVGQAFYSHKVFWNYVIKLMNCMVLYLFLSLNVVW